jgi:hypothetical protein
VLELQLELSEVPDPSREPNYLEDPERGIPYTRRGAGAIYSAEDAGRGRASRFRWWAWAVAQCYHVGDGS